MTTAIKAGSVFACLPAHRHQLFCDAARYGLGSGSADGARRGGLGNQVAQVGEQLHVFGRRAE